MRVRALAFVVLMAGSALMASAAPSSAQEEPTNCPKPLTPEQCNYDPGPAPTTPKPATPKPSTPKPTTRPVATRRPSTSTTTTQPRTTSAPSSVTGAPLETPFDLDVGPIGTPEIVVQGPVIEDDSSDDQPLEAERAAAGGGAFWIGLLIGLVIGGLVGRASWGLQRRRRQQIFG
jgi:hypothetical protein